MKTVVARFVVVCTCTFLVSCTDDPTMQEPTGFVSVQVVDISSKQPVADVEITIAGTNLVAETDASGTAVFEIAAGEYFVDARVCCVGPGFIEHHVPVIVDGGKRVDVSLHACLACL